MAVILKKVKRIAAFAAALLTAAAIPCSTYADDEMIIEIIPETADTIVTVKPEKDKPLYFRHKRQGQYSGHIPYSYKADGHISFDLQLGDKFLKSRNKRQ